MEILGEWRFNKNTTRIQVWNGPKFEEVQDPILQRSYIMELDVDEINYLIKYGS